LGEGAVDAGGSGEVGAERLERQCVKRAFRARFSGLSGRVMSAELGRRCFASPSISKGELATRSGSVRRGPSLRFVAQDADPGRIGEFVRRLVGGRF
jgi:hypothetical protein